MLKAANLALWNAASMKPGLISLIDGVSNRPATAKA